jgi:hypothetical protein
MHACQEQPGPEDCLRAAAGLVAGHVSRRRGLAGLLDGLLDKVLGSRLLQRVASPAVSLL